MQYMETLAGRIQNGVVVFDGKPPLPEGMEVIVTFPRISRANPPRPKKRVDLPFVKSRHPGSLQLTGDMVAEFLNDDDLPT
jgi:hypothetical protein